MTAVKTWRKIALLTEIPAQGSRVVQYGEIAIAVFRNHEDQVFALHDKCPHKGGPLSQGIVYGNKVVCPLHQWKISLENGDAEAPDEGHTACFLVKVENGMVYLEI